MKEFKTLYYETVECVRCNLCLDNCPVVRAVGLDKAPLYASVYTAMGSRFDLDRTANDALCCIDCYECETACPIQVPIADTMCHLRGLAVEEGLMSDAMRSTVEKARTGKNIFGTPIEYPMAQGDVAFFPGYAGELDKAVLDGFVKICSAAGIRGTILTGMADSGYLISRAGFNNEVEKYVENNVRMFRESGAKTIVTPCSYSYEAFVELYPDDFTYLHISQFAGRLLEEGKIQLKASNQKVAYHDTHFLSRINGIQTEPRRLLKAATGCDAAEPYRTGKQTASSGVGGGLGLFCPDIMREVNKARGEELACLGLPTVVCGCAMEKYALQEELNAKEITVYELTEFVAKALA